MKISFSQHLCSFTLFFLTATLYAYPDRTVLQKYLTQEALSKQGNIASGNEEWEAKLLLNEGVMLKDIREGFKKQENRSGIELKTEIQNQKECVYNIDPSSFKIAFTERPDDEGNYAGVLRCPSKWEVRQYLKEISSVNKRILVTKRGNKKIKWSGILLSQQKKDKLKFSELVNALKNESEGSKILLEYFNLYPVYNFDLILNGTNHVGNLILISTIPKKFEKSQWESVGL